MYNLNDGVIGVTFAASNVRKMLEKISQHDGESFNYISENKIIQGDPVMYQTKLLIGDPHINGKSYSSDSYTIDSINFNNSFFICSGVQSDLANDFKSIFLFSFFFFLKNNVTTKSGTGWFIESSIQYVSFSINCAS